MELDHLFLAVPDRGACGDPLVAFGLTEGSGNRHEGQGTANRRFFFPNLMLEILWVEDEREARSALTGPMGLFERCREAGASPFGVGIRAEGPLSFPAWEYRPRYLGGRGCLRVGCGSGVQEPLVFCLPEGVPSCGVRHASEPRAWGESRVAEVELHTRQEVPLGAPRAALNGLEGFRAVRGDRDLLVLRLEGPPGEGSRCFLPGLPLELRW